jgi:hypothetical protein
MDKEQYLKDKKKFKEDYHDAICDVYVTNLRSKIHESINGGELLKINDNQYKFISQLLWGGSPVDKDWAMQTKKFEEEAPKILEKYPMLNKSFHGKNN